MATPNTSASSSPLVLVTGGSGFLGMHCIVALLKSGYRVRATLRTLSRQTDVLNALKSCNDLDATALNRLTFAAANLLSDEGWATAAKDATYVLHVASPFPAAPPKSEDDLITPAREGTLRVLRAARDSKSVKRVVVTSSFAAIAHGDTPPKGKLYDETLWTHTDGHVGLANAYQKSKTLAERAAWSFIEKEGAGLELSVVNPVGIFGPVFSADFATSIILVQRLLNGDLPGLPDLEFSVVDARDCADLHVLAMTHPKAKGERFLAVAPSAMLVKDISLTLRKRMGEKARRAPTRGVPNFVLRIVALWDPTVALVLPNLGVRREVSNEKARRLLGWEPRWSNEDAVVATGESLVRLGLVKG
jgi:nucleoside-diphosphate-sugar epimerase